MIRSRLSPTAPGESQIRRRVVVVVVGALVAITIAGIPGAGAAEMASNPAFPSPGLAPKATGALLPLVSARSTTVQPCGRTRTPRTWDHVIWIWLENHSVNQTIGSTSSSAGRSMPYFNGLARSCGLATNYHAITHPSLPNYLNAVSGSSTARSNCSPRSCSQRQTSLLTLLNRSHKTWRVYSESMSSACSARDVGLYRVKHNPAPYFPALGRTCRLGNQPLGTPTRGNFASALAHSRVARFNFVVPNMCNSAHDCSLAAGDRWLRLWVPRILASQSYRAGRTAIFVSWDEGAGGRHGMSCATSTDQSCHVATVVVSPSTRRGARSAISFSHWSLLRTTEEMLRVRPLLGHSARSNSMRRAFGL